MKTPRRLCAHALHRRSEKLARVPVPGASKRRPEPLRSALGGAAIGSKQMHVALLGANTCAHG